MEEVRKIGNDQESAGENDEDEDEEVESGGGRVSAHGRAIWGIWVVGGGGFGGGGGFFEGGRGHGDGGGEEVMAHDSERKGGVERERMGGRDGWKVFQVEMWGSEGRCAS